MKYLLAILISVFVFSGCGRLDFGVQYFQHYIISEADDMFDLSTPQKNLFDKKFSAQLQKVKQEQFPVYADYLDKIRVAYEQQNLSNEKASQLFDQGVQLFEQTGPQWKSTVEELVMTLKNEQLKAFETYFNEKLAKQKKKLKTESDRQEKQLDFMNKWIDQTIEDLTRGQKERLKQYIKSNPKPYELSWKSEEHVMEKFKESFNETEKRKAFIQKFLTNWRQLQLPEYVKAQELYREKLKDYVIDLSLNLNEKQKKNLIENLKKRAGELRELAK